MPRGRSALGSAPTTSARPPVFANGATSDETNRTFSWRWGVAGAPRVPRPPSAEPEAPTRSARVDPVVDLREDVVALFHVGEPPLGDLGGLHVVVELFELQDVLVDAAGGVGDGGAGLHDERPVGGLCQHQ